MTTTTTTKDFLLGYIEAHTNDKPTDILGFDASPSHTWSEYTQEDFSATLNYSTATNKYNSYFLEEKEVIELLNSLWRSTQPKVPLITDPF